MRAHNNICYLSHYLACQISTPISWSSMCVVESRGKSLMCQRFTGCFSPSDAYVVIQSMYALKVVETAGVTTQLCLGCHEEKYSDTVKNRGDPSCRPYDKKKINRKIKKLWLHLPCLSQEASEHTLTYFPPLQKRLVDFHSTCIFY